MVSIPNTQRVQLCQVTHQNTSRREKTRTYVFWTDQFIHWVACLKKCVVPSGLKRWGGVEGRRGGIILWRWNLVDSLLHATAILR